MSVATTHVLPSPELLDDDLLRLELIDDLADHPGTLDGGSANGRFAISPREQENLREDQFVTGLPIAPIDLNPITLAHPELVAAVNKQIERLRIDFPGYEFIVEFGK